MNPIRIAGTGSAIADYLYDNVDFSSAAFGKYISHSAGDGGLEPGKLVHTDGFEAFAGCSVETALNEIVSGRPPRSFNLGGPAIAALICAAQMLHEDKTPIRFYAANGTDEAGKKLRTILGKTPVDTGGFFDVEGSSPYTIALSDPNFNNGAGERTFLNNIGSSWKMLPEYLDEAFFNADIRLFGGTALVPPIHDALTSLLMKASDPQRLSIVSTVYDFRNEKKHPDRHWPLGETLESYPLIDLLVVDAEEAERLTGTTTTKEAQEEFRRRGLSALVITSGTDNVICYSSGERFDATETQIPISQTNLSERGDAPWDTTGCGDNFVGALLFSLARQMQAGETRLNLVEACRWGVCAGDFACYSLGGTYLEKAAGEKLSHITSIHRRYEEHYHG